MAPIYKSYIMSSATRTRPWVSMDNYCLRQGLICEQKSFLVVQKHFPVHLACALKDIWNKKKYKDVGSSIDRFLWLGCKLSGKPFFW